MIIPDGRELVLLAEEESGQVRCRSVLIKPGLVCITERLHLSKDHVHERLWVCDRGEWDLTKKCRVFREVLPPPEPEPADSPTYDETRVTIDPNLG